MDTQQTICSYHNSSIIGEHCRFRLIWRYIPTQWFVTPVSILMDCLVLSTAQDGIKLPGTHITLTKRLIEENTIFSVWNTEQSDKIWYYKYDILWIYIYILLLSQDINFFRTELKSLIDLMLLIPTHLILNDIVHICCFRLLCSKYVENKAPNLAWCIMLTFMIH